ncbi:TetR/AcrR family transcriptional regulator [Amycolatopsis sp. PS_44_ISF1]|uniref:TetR/AcrR family transcriptional regulator n=1 Tax=Amycolatopsis sp. PS_44_ISF1 TaxID=2974917 RepID=UPI0028DF439A|nr:TetR/AcrR family transcriptional regulator [Amycolatopsis sp. PS_44_ISF1]MDT8914934.1 TetR/AcrR family transcriptional regulator [Amycolatopsis sp. PS_44_ISF1]
MPEIKRRTPTGAAVLRPDLTDSIIEAVLDELAEKGYQSLSMDAVARRAGVGKSALYRRWPSKLEMTVSTFVRLSVPLTSIPDTGSFRGDLRKVLDEILAWLGHPRHGRIFTDLLGAARTNPELARALTEDIAAPRRELGMEVLDRAVARGEVPAEVNRELALDVFAAPVFWRLHARREVVTAEYLDEVADLMVKAFT